MNARPVERALVGGDHPHQPHTAEKLQRYTDAADQARLARNAMVRTMAAR